MREEILRILRAHERESHFSGVCLIRRGDSDIVHQALGLAHRGLRVPNTVNTRFDIASVTKLFTATAIMQLVDRGMLSLDTPLMPMLGIRDTPISDDVTVYHCLTHTSGIADDADEEAGEDYELLFVDRPNYAIRETRDFLSQCTGKPHNFPPGSGVRYNNCAFVLLGLVIESISGLAFRDYVRQRIFSPAGMRSADFCAMDGDCENLAEHYKKVNGPAGGITWRKNIYSYPPIGSPDGGATVTADDLHRFMQSILENRLMSAEASRLLLTPQVMRKKTVTGALWNGFGFEFELDHNGSVVMISKEGMNAGVASFLTRFPATETNCILLANQDCDVWGMHREIGRVL